MPIPNHNVLPTAAAMIFLTLCCVEVARGRDDKEEPSTSEEFSDKDYSDEGRSSPEPQGKFSRLLRPFRSSSPQESDWDADAFTFPYNPEEQHTQYCYYPFTNYAFGRSPVYPCVSTCAPRTREQLKEQYPGAEKHVTEDYAAEPMCVASDMPLEMEIPDLDTCKPKKNPKTLHFDHFMPCRPCPIQIPPPPSPEQETKTCAVTGDGMEWECLDQSECHIKGTDELGLEVGGPGSPKKKKNKHKTFGTAIPTCEYRSGLTSVRRRKRAPCKVCGAVYTLPNNKWNIEDDKKRSAALRAAEMAPQPSGQLYPKNRDARAERSFRFPPNPWQEKRSAEKEAKKEAQRERRQERWETAKSVGKSALEATGYALEFAAEVACDSGEVIGEGAGLFAEILGAIFEVLD